MKTKLLVLVIVVICLTAVLSQAQYQAQFRRQGYIGGMPPKMAVQSQPPQLTQYGLQVYAGGDPVNYTDPWGLKKCNAHHYRMTGGYGHEGLLINGNDYDFGPAFVDGSWVEQLWGATYGLSPWPYNDTSLGDDSFKWKKELKVRETGTMTVGGKVIKCKCASCFDIQRCANEQSADWNGSRFLIVGHSCRTFARRTKKKCCLTN